MNVLGSIVRLLKPRFCSRDAVIHYISGGAFQ
jgi:hypothetical protein